MGLFLLFQFKNTLNKPKTPTKISAGQMDGPCTVRPILTQLLFVPYRAGPRARVAAQARPVNRSYRAEPAQARLAH